MSDKFYGYERALENKYKMFIHLMFRSQSFKYVILLLPAHKRLSVNHYAVQIDVSLPKALQRFFINVELCSKIESLFPSHWLEYKINVCVLHCTGVCYLLVNLIINTLRWAIDDSRSSSSLPVWVSLYDELRSCVLRLICSALLTNKNILQLCSDNQCKGVYHMVILAVKQWTPASLHWNVINA